MLERISSLSFRDFGKFNAKYLRADIPGEVEKIIDSEDGFTCYPTTSTYIVRQSGMPVLTVSSDDLKTIHTFYLDTPVMLKPGIWHKVQMACSESSVQKTTLPNAAFVKTPSPVGETNPLLSPQIAVNNIYTFFYQERDHNYLFPGETHNPYEFTYIDSGQLHSVAGGCDTLLQQGEIMLYSPGQWHMQYSDNNNPVYFVTISFDMDCHLSDILTDRKFSATNEMKHILSQMLDEQDKNRFLCNEMILSLMKSLLILLFRDAYSDDLNEPVSRIKNARENNIVDMVQQYIAENLHRRVTVEKVAKANNISVSFMSSLFRKHLSISPGSYIRRAKLNESKRMIRDEQLPIKTIASKLDYSTIQHFSRCFKDEFSITPSDYANSVRNRYDSESFFPNRLISLSENTSFKDSTIQWIPNR